VIERFRMGMSVSVGDGPTMPSSLLLKNRIVPQIIFDIIE
jgi:hypothetical protein